MGAGVFQMGCASHAQVKRAHDLHPNTLQLLAYFEAGFSVSSLVEKIRTYDPRLMAVSRSSHRRLYIYRPLAKKLSPPGRWETIEVSLPGMAEAQPVSLHALPNHRLPPNRAAFYHLRFLPQLHLV
jgi:hypothetical protein